MRLRWRFRSPYVLYFTASRKGEGGTFMPFSDNPQYP